MTIAGRLFFGRSFDKNISLGFVSILLEWLDRFETDQVFQRVRLRSCACLR